MRKIMDPAEEHAERSARNHSPDGRACQLCKWFCPLRPQQKNSSGECRASLPVKQDDSRFERFHEEVRHDHWCAHFEQTEYAKKFRLLHNQTLLEEARAERAYAALAESVCKKFDA